MIGYISEEAPLKYAYGAYSFIPTLQRGLAWPYKAQIHKEAR